MRRAVLMRRIGWGTSANDIAFKQLPRTTRTDTKAISIWWPAPGPFQITERHGSSFKQGPNPTTSPFGSNTRSPTSKLLRDSQKGLSSPWRLAVSQLRPFSSTSHLREAPRDTERQDRIEKEKARREEEEEDRLDEQPG